MRLVATISVTHSVQVCVFVHVCVWHADISPAKAAAPIEMSFGMQTRVRPRNRVLFGVAHWRHLPNADERSVSGDDARLCQITLASSVMAR